MFRRIIPFLCLLLLAAPALAQTPSLAGDWHGTLDTGRGHLRVLFQFSGTGGVTIVSVDQGGAHIPGTSVLTGRDVTVQVPSLSAGYRGTLDAGGKTLTGTWTQGAGHLPLILTRGPFKAQAPQPGDVTLQTPTGALAGTLKIAHGPAILILAGSGPTDRNGNSAFGLDTNSYKLLADGLAAKDITTLRVDKRGIGASSAAMGPESNMRIQTYVDDAIAWARFLKKRTGVKCIWLLGHSEGGLIAELADGGPDICGLVLIAAPGRKLKDILKTEIDAAPMPPEEKQKALAILATLDAGHTVAKVPAGLAALFRPSVQPYLMSELSLDPAAILAKSHKPVLILQGSTDLQVTVQDAKRLAAARPDAKLVILPGVNHVLKIAPADRALNVATYSNPALPLAPGIVKAIAAFVHSS